MALSNGWPDLSRFELQPTTEALHLWSQVVGKIRLSFTPWINHSWHVPLYVSARGLSTGLIPVGSRGFDMEFDFFADVLIIRETDGQEKHVALTQQSVAAFYANTVEALNGLDIHARLNPIPCELPQAVQFDSDVAVRLYESEAARAWWYALVQTHRVFQIFRTRFVGKCSPIHMFWGSFDLAVTRFSGRKAPPHPGGVAHVPDAVSRDAYDQEVSSAGFWPGGGNIKSPSYYSYAYPAPNGFAQARVQPGAASYDGELGEFLMPYEAVRTSADPDTTLLSFLQSTYEAAAILAHWDRLFLERPTGPIGYPPIGA
jgi:hypothetical protein